MTALRYESFPWSAFRDLEMAGSVLESTSLAPEPRRWSAGTATQNPENYVP